MAEGPFWLHEVQTAPASHCTPNRDSDRTRLVLQVYKAVLRCLTRVLAWVEIGSEMEGRRVKRVDGTKRLQKFLDLYREATSISLVPCSERHRFRQPDNINETDTEKEVQWLCRRRFPKTMVLANEAMLGTMQNKLLQLMDKRGLSHAPMRRPKELFEHVRFTCTSRFEELVYFAVLTHLCWAPACACCQGLIC